MRTCLLSLLLLSALPLPAAIRTWDGGSSLTSNWTDAANWGGNILPVAGDTLVFGQVASRKTNINDFPAGTVFASIQVSGTDYVLEGNEAVVSALTFFITTAGTAPQVNLPLRASGPFSVQMTNDTVTPAIVRGGINNAGFPVTLNNLSLFVPFDVRSSITGAGGLTKMGPGVVAMSGTSASTYAGTTTVDSGTLSVSGSNTPGDATGGTVVNSGARFSTGRSELTENFTLSGTLTTGKPGDIILHGTVDAAGPGARLDFTSLSGSLTMDGAVTGAFPLVKSGPGTVFFTGSSAWSGAGLTIEDGRVILFRSGPAAGGVFTIGDGSGLVDSAVLQAGLGAQLAVNSSLIIKPDGAYDLAGHVQTLNGSISLEQGHLNGYGDLKLGGTITTLPAAEPSLIEGYLQFTASAAWNVADGPAPVDLRMAAEITAATASPRITKSGAGRLDWSGNSTADFELAATEGTLLVNGVNPEVRVFGSAGANIGGNGTVARLNPNDGSAANVLPGGSAPGRVETRTLLFGPAAPGGTLRIQLNGPSPGTSHDQVRLLASAIVNSIRLDGGTLEVVSSNGFQPAFGQVFTIIDNQDDDTTLGIFAGLPEASVLTLNGKQLRLSYTGGDGNDVTLTCTTLSGVLRTWTGGGATNNWSDAANWGGTAPQASDRLLFPEGAARPVNVNDLAAGFVLDSITLEGGGWAISGNEIGLLNGFVFTGAGASNQVTVPVTLLQSQNWATNRATSSYTIIGIVDLDAFDLSLTGTAGVIRFAAAVSGSGSLVVGGGISCELFAANTFTGPLTLQSGSDLRVPHSGGLGDPTGPTVLEAGATISITSSGFTTAEPFICSGGRIYTGMNGTALSGPVTLTSGAVSFEIGSRGVLTLSGEVGGPGTLQKTGKGTLTLSGTVRNFQRYTIISAGLVQLQKTGSAAALMNDVTIAGGATVRLLAAGQFHSGATNLTAEPGSVLDLNGFTSIVPNATLNGATVLTGTASGVFLTGNLIAGASTNGSTIAGPGAVRIGTNRTWTVEDGPADNDLTVSAFIDSTEGGILSKAGAGHLRSTGANLIPQIKVLAGSASFDGICEATAVTVGDATVSGSGKTNALMLDAAATTARIAPGGFTPAGLPSRRLTTNSLNAAGGSGVLEIEIGGTVAGTDHDQVQIDASAAADAVNLTGLTLDVQLAPGYVPPLNTQFVILQNNSADTSFGIFTGKPHQSFITRGPVQFVIGYTAAGVTLTAFNYTGSERRWTGAGANNLWSTAANWQGNTAPAAGDRLIFPAGAARPVNVNDLPADTPFSSITIESSAYSLSGNRAGITSAVRATHTSGALNCSLPLDILRGSLWSMTALPTTWSGAITLSGGMLTIEGRCDFAGLISGPLGLIIEDGDPVTLSAANTYTGPTEVRDGLLVLNDAQALGGTILGTRVYPGAAIQLNAPGAVAEPVTLEGALIASGGTRELSGKLTVNGSGVSIILSSAGTELTLSGELTGAAPVDLSGSGAVVLSGSAPVSLTGAITTTVGALRLRRTPAGGAPVLTAPITIGGGIASAQVSIENAQNQFASALTVQVGAYGFLMLNGHDESIAALTLSGGAVQTATATGRLTVNDLAVSASTLTSTITGPGSIHRTGSGEWSILDGSASPDLSVSAIISADGESGTTMTGGGSLVSTGANTIRNFTLSEGTARFDGLSPDTAVLVQNGTLMGSGQLRMVQVDDHSLAARIAPGASAGRLRANTLLFPASAEGILEIELGGASPGTTFDQFQVESSAINNSVNLNGAALDLRLINGFTPAIGANFRILNNLDGDASTGTFLGQPEASTFTAGGFTWSITYQGGDGNDVVITRINPSGVPAPSVVNFTNAFSPDAGGAGVPGRTIAFSGQGQAGQPYKLQGSRNLTTWVDLATATANSSGVVTFNFTDTANLPRRMYRVVVP